MKRERPIPRNLPEGLVAFRERRYQAWAHWQLRRDILKRHARRPMMLSAVELAGQAARLTAAPST